MILFFNAQPVTELKKIEKLFERAKNLYGSDFYDLQTINWLGDKLTTESLFPNWILQEYKNNPSNVLVVSIIKNYLRWLFSLEYGYGAQLDWEHLRAPLTVKPIFLEAYSDFYFPNSDFTTEPLKDFLPNIRKFSLRADCNYFNIKGTPEAIKYLICNLFNFNWDDVEVYTSESATIQINILASEYNNFINFIPFIEEYAIPAGMHVIYGTK